MTLSVLDATATSTSLKSTNNSGIHTPHQNIDTLVAAQLPTSLGQTTKSVSLSVAIASDQTVSCTEAPSTSFIEQITGIPAVGGTASLFTTQTLTKGMTIRNCSTSGQIMYITKAATTPTATNGYILAPGESTPFLECTNANAWKLLGSASSGAACYAGS